MFNTLHDVESQDLAANREQKVRPQCAERLDGGHVKGSMVRGHIDWVRDHRDRDEVIAFFENIPRSMRNVLVSSWYRFEDAMEIDRIIMNRFGLGELSFLQDLGAYSARQSLSGGHSLFDRSGVHDFFRRSALLHAQVQNFGRAKYVALAPTEAQMILDGCDWYSPLYCSSAIGFYRECIRLYGGVDVDVWEPHCQCRGDDSCTFELFWA